MFKKKVATSYDPLSGHGKYKSFTRIAGRVILAAIISLSMFSCITQQRLTYLENPGVTDSISYFRKNQPEYRLQKQDILYVKFNTPNDEVNGSLNGGSMINNQNMFQSERGVYINGFSVSDSGYVTLPVIGDVYVLGKTIEEATAEIENRSLQYLKESTVTVKLISFRVTVIGEVNVPGTYYIYKSSVNVLEAIGLAADITDYGDRSKVLVVRSTDTGTKTFTINLQKRNLLSTEGYYLLPNDIVIVNPLRAKFILLNSPTISFFLSTVTTSITLTLLIIKVL
jgi:polysaccharide biosynthesis/export protein